MKTEVTEAIPSQAAMASGIELMQLLVRPVTGRKHQIRAHFASIGRPLVGDRTYGKKLKSILPTPRLFLHCHYLKFFDLQGKDVVVEDPLPLDLRKILAALKRKKHSSICGDLPVEKSIGLVLHFESHIIPYSHSV